METKLLHAKKGDDAFCASLHPIFLLDAFNAVKKIPESSVSEVASAMKELLVTAAQDLSEKECK